MASIAAACRLSSRLAARQMRKDVQSRGYRSSPASLAAHNFTMPALSPTMTEGNIATWKVKEGDSFVAGDVLLEIETDKASMDVEAQDDGIVAKIFHGDGTKGIKIGTRIGVLAEAGDDIASLQIPADQSAAPAAEPAKQEPPKSEPQPPKRTEAEPAQAAETAAPPRKQNLSYPLLPSVQHLIHAQNLSAADVAKIVPTGPKGQLLKGDVLAHLGHIAASSPAALASKFEKLSHLDLSNIKIAPRKPVAAAPAAAAKETVPPAPEQPVQVALPISMAAALDVQQRIAKKLHIHLPLSTLIARAADAANECLPRSKLAAPSADALFDAVLGLKSAAPNSVRGNFLPQVSALPQAAVAPRVRTVAQGVDVIDFLSGRVRSTAPRRVVPAAAQLQPAPETETSLFSVSVPRGDEARARVFLERVKEVLEEEPGRLVL